MEGVNHNLMRNTKKELILKHDDIFLKLIDAKAENLKLQYQLTSQKVSLGLKVQDFRRKILQFEKEREKLRGHISKQDAYFSIQKKQLVQKQLALEFANTQLRDKNCIEEARKALNSEVSNLEKSFSSNLKKQLEQKTKECLDLKRKLEEERENKSCPICFYPWKDSGNHRLVSLTCGHLFGDKCLRHHLTRSPTCPICRKCVDTRHIIYIYNNNVVPNCS